MVQNSRDIKQRTSGQNGGIGRHTSPPSATPKELQLNLKTTPSTVRKSNCMVVQQRRI